MYGLGAGVPITCAADEQVHPITAWVTSPDDPAYLAASNWTCVKKSVMAEQSGFTFAAGLKTWVNPLVAAPLALMSLPSFANAPAYTAGLLTPLAALAAYFAFRNGGGRGR
jgi:hypothetical protein